jgi:hypothetical protein
MCVWRPATHAMYRACSLAMKPGRITWGCCVSMRSPFASNVCSAVKYSASRYHFFRCGCLSLMQVDGQTALHMAAANGHADTVKALLAAGANVSATAVRGLVSRVRVGSHGVCRACRVTWGHRFSRGSPFASAVSSAVECSAPWCHYFILRLFVTGAGGWLDHTAHSSREWSHGCRECSAGSWGHRVCNSRTWACVTCVCGGPLWRPATRAVYRACSLAVMHGRVTFARRGDVAFLRDLPFASVVSSKDC